VSKSFEFKELDAEGAEILDVIGDAPRFNRWMYETIRPWCEGEILEIGSGIGNISAFFLQDGHKLHLSDIRDVYCARLAQKFQTAPSLLGIDRIDIAAHDFDQRYAALTGRFDSVFILNVVEHIEDDLQAVINCRKLLKPGGKLVVLVPAFQALYNGFDEALEHYRRYNKSRLTQLLQKAEFRVIHKQYFNLAGILGWYVSGKLEKNKTIPKGEMKLYNMLVPLFRVADRVFFRAFGLSVIAVGEK
jgi:2-polyprenyl-3-methyl-5-hydroxy-6-metoxy-1,4-benzoquinol methylase